MFRKSFSIYLQHPVISRPGTICSLSVEVTVKTCNYAVCYLVLLSILYKLKPNFVHLAASFLSVIITEHPYRNPDCSRNQSNCGSTKALTNFMDVGFESSKRWSYKATLGMKYFVFNQKKLTFENVQHGRNYLILDLTAGKGYTKN